MARPSLGIRPIVFKVVWKVQTFMFRRTWRLSREPDRFLRNSRGVIHVGANSGQERDHYEKAKLEVVWIEPVPAVFAALVSNIRNHPRQKALNALATDTDGKEYQFHVANNAGLSSSIFDLKLHRDIWPQVDYDETIRLEGSRLDTLLARNSLDPLGYDALVLDTQGSELLVLRGAEELLRTVRYLKTEVADFEAYEGCCTLADLEQFLVPLGFVEFARTVTALHPNGGSYYDVVYRRKT